MNPPNKFVYDYDIFAQGCETIINGPVLLTVKREDIWTNKHGERMNYDELHGYLRYADEEYKWNDVLPEDPNFKQEIHNRFIQAACNGKIHKSQDQRIEVSVQLLRGSSFQHGRRIFHDEGPHNESIDVEWVEGGTLDECYWHVNSGENGRDCDGPYNTEREYVIPFRSNGGVDL